MQSHTDTHPRPHPLSTSRKPPLHALPHAQPCTRSTHTAAHECTAAHSLTHCLTQHITQHQPAHPDTRWPHTVTSRPAPGSTQRHAACTPADRACSLGEGALTCHPLQLAALFCLLKVIRCRKPGTQVRARTRGGGSASLCSRHLGLEIESRDCPLTCAQWSHRPPDVVHQPLTASLLLASLHHLSGLLHNSASQLVLP